MYIARVCVSCSSRRQMRRDGAHITRQVLWAVVISWPGAISVFLSHVTLCPEFFSFQCTLHLSPSPNP
jgi:hypothetical protein